MKNTCNVTLAKARVYGMLAFASMTLCGAAAAAQEIKIDRQTCKYLTRHVAAPDVNFQPGTDVRGKKVVTADLNAAPVIGDSFTIPITVDLGEKYGLNKARGTEATVGMVTVDGNKTYLNGQPLDAQDEENIAVLCLEANGGRQ